MSSGGRREIVGIFLVKNHDFTPKKSYFIPILEGERAQGAPPLDLSLVNAFLFVVFQYLWS